MRRARKVDRVLAETYPDARCELDFDDPVRAAGRDRAQRPDHRPPGQRRPAHPLRRLPRPDRDGRRPPREHLEQIVGPLGFFRAKTDALLKLSQALVERYDGQVPGRLDDLVTLPGVGRKTANVVLGNAFGVPGITVDTHFGRLVRRFGWTEETDPVKVEHAIGGALPQARLDDALPPRHLARPPSLPRQEARLRRLPARPALPVVRDRARPTPIEAEKLVKTQGPA